MPAIHAWLVKYCTFDNPQSSVFNTDVQIFSDIGAPCILMMEDYD